MQVNRVPNKTPFEFMNNFIVPKFSLNIDSIEFVLELPFLIQMTLGGNPLINEISRKSES